jgi:hypothetical protein
MTSRAVRWVFRIAGWILTPVVLILAAAVGAFIGLVMAPRFPPYTALIVTAALAFLTSLTGLIFWVRLLRVHPELRERLAITEQGVPESELISKLTGETSTEPQS